jgi:hypothetical protein
MDGEHSVPDLNVSLRFADRRSRSKGLLFRKPLLPRHCTSVIDTFAPYP